MSRLGIDFGTSYCTMAAWNDQDAKPVVIRGRSGNEKIPTVVFWSADGNHEVGEGALNRWMDGGTLEEQWELQLRTIRSVKRNFSPQYVIPMPDGSIVRAVDVAAVVLKQLKTEAEEGYFHGPVSAVRITYPATFTKVQQDLLRKAAKTAGFEEIELLKEPIAAVLGYAAVHNQVENGILVYDLGGGTLDLAYVRREADGSWTIPIPPSGSPDCGGDDFDRMIYDWAQQKFLNPGEHFGKDEYNVNPEILLSCRDLKETLSSRETGIASVFHDNKRLVLKLTRQEFNRLIEEKISNSIDMVRQLQQDITAAQQTIDAVILIGGSSRIPCIREKLTEVLPIKPLDTMARDIAVALGAAGNEKLSLPVEETANVTANPASDFEYTKSDGGVTIEKLKNKEMEGQVVIPRTIDNLPVTSIGKRAFEGCDNLTSLTIPASVTSIEDYAFSGCSGLTSLMIPVNVTSIGKEAFYGCSSLTSLTLPARVTSIGNSTFSGCSDLTSLTLPACVTSIGHFAFKGCENLTSLTIPAGVTSIGMLAFYGCSGLTSLTIPKNVSSIGNSTFSDCINLTSLTLPASVTSIGHRAFSHCSGLTSLTIPKNVSSIGNSTFSDCINLTSLTLPASVTSIGHRAFSHCSGLTSLTLPASVISIGDYAFERCENLTSLTLPASVTSIGNGAFWGCSGLTSLTIPASVTSIGMGAFNGCDKLTIRIPKGSAAEKYAKEKRIKFTVTAFSSD